MSSTSTRRSPGHLAVGWGLVRAGVFLATHRDVPLPGYDGRVAVQARCDDGDVQDRMAWLVAAAEALGSPVERGASRGTWLARRRFGPVTVSAHVSDLAYTTQMPVARERTAA